MAISGDSSLLEPVYLNKYSIPTKAGWQDLTAMLIVMT